jgi:Abortive infection alpha
MAADDLELVKTGIEAITSEAIKPVSDLIRSLFGPAAEEAGLMLKDHVRVFRAKRQLRLYLRTAEIFEKTGLRPQHVPLKLLFPIVENASVEESDDLQDRWANLLAHAADPAEGHTVSISFPTILRELTPRQAKFLDAIYHEAVKRSDRWRKHGAENVSFSYVDFISLFTDAGLARYPSHQRYTMAESDRQDVKDDEHERQVAVDMFKRHGVIEDAYEIPRNQRSSPHWEPEIDSTIQFTLLGAQFVAACLEPKAKSGVGQG